jgi:hypothetical protein
MPDVVTVGGLSLTGTWSTGVVVRTNALGGWSGSPGTSIALTQKPRTPGAWVSPRQLKERILTPSGLLTAPDRDTLRAALDTLDAAAAVDPETFTVTEGTLTRSITVYRQDEVVATVESDTVASWSMQLVAPDPRKFGTAVSTSTALPATTGGLQLPFTLPNTIPASVVTGQAFLTNPGNTTGPVTLQIHGPVTAPVVTHVSSGTQLVFSSNLSLASGEWLDIDMEAQTVLLRGQASRSGYITQRGWFGFDPGLNTFSFTAVTGDVGASLTVTGTPAWL